MSIAELCCLERRMHVQALTRGALVFGRQPTALEQLRVVDPVAPFGEPGNRNASLISSVQS